MMSNRTDFYSFRSSTNEKIFWVDEKLNFQTLENQLKAFYIFVGDGVVNGWEVVTVTQEEVDALPDDVKATLIHTESCMMVKVTTGDGAVKHMAGATMEDAYIAFPIENESRVYYIYAEATDTIQTHHKARIIYTLDSDYDSDHDAVYLARVITYFDDLYDEVYVYLIPSDDPRRRILLNMESAVTDANRELVLRHKHLGTPDTPYQAAVPNTPSKIQLGTQVVENLTVVPASTIFLVSPFYLPDDLTTTFPRASGMRSLPTYVDAKVKVNGIVLSGNSYCLDNTGGKLYLQNSILEGDVVQVIKFLDPANTQIARGPQDDPPSTLKGSPPIVTGENALVVNPRYKLPASRLGEIDAGKFVFGTISPRRIRPISHYGMSRIRERATLVPRTMTRTRDQLEYYLVPPDREIGFDTEMPTIFRSFILGNVVSTPHGIFKMSGLDDDEMIRMGYEEDRGRVIEFFDDLVEGEHGGEDRFHESYLLNDTGEVWITKDEGEMWELLDTPAIDGMEILSFCVSTDKVEREVKNRKTYDYYKVLHLGTNIGLWSATVLGAKGNATGGSDIVLIETIPWRLTSIRSPVHSLQEIITVHITVTSDDTKEGYDRTLYAGTEVGVYVGNRIVRNTEDILITDMRWLDTNNGIMLLSEDGIYISHTAEHKEVMYDDTTENYWIHPLTDTSEEIHLSFDLSTIGRKGNKLSQETGRAKYIVGLDLGVGISSTDGLVNSDWYPLINPSARIVVLSNRSVHAISSRVSVIGLRTSGLQTLGGHVKVISTANAADQAARSGSEKEIADGWKPLDWVFPSTKMRDVQDVLVTITSEAMYDPTMGMQQQVTDYLAATAYGLWQSSDGGRGWFRPSPTLGRDVVPYVEKDGVGIVSELGGYTIDHDLQAVVFTTEQNTFSVIRIEKEFEEYFAIGGKWEQQDADLMVYINKEVSTVPYTATPLDGKIAFEDSLKSANNEISLSVIKAGAYLVDVGETPHSELIASFVPDTNVKTQTSEDIAKGSRNIKVYSTKSFPAGFIYINIDEENLRVKKTDDHTFFAVDKPSATDHVKTSDVTLILIRRVPGIDDRITMSESGLSFDWQSIQISNLMILQMEARHVWNDMFEDVPRDPPAVGATVIDGAVQEQIHIGGTDPLDTTGSSSTLWSGLDIPTTGASKPPRIISVMNDPPNAGFTIGGDRGVWRFDGTEWAQLSDLDGAGFVNYIEENGRLSSVDTCLMVGTSDGLWTTPDDGITWYENPTFFQQQLGYLQSTIKWFDDKTFECYGKSDGMSMVVYGWDDDDPNSFHSDHFDPIDGKRVYDFFKGYFYRIDEETGQKQTFDSLWVLSEEGVWLCYNGTRYYANGSANPYSALLKGREAVDPGYRTDTSTNADGENITTVTSGSEEDLSKNQRYIVTGYDSDGNPVYGRLRFYKVFQAPMRPWEKYKHLIFLTNDGIRVAMNWRWLDPETEDIFLFWMASPFSTTDPDQRTVCSCFTTGVDDTIDDDSPDAWKKWKIFIGTDRGLYRSYSPNCEAIEPCQRISGASAIYSLEYVDGVLYAGTDNGYWVSSNDGDDWSLPSLEIGNAVYPNGRMLGQTFTPEYPEVTKVGLYLHPKER